MALKELLSLIDAEIATLKEARALLAAGSAVTVAKRTPGRPPKAQLDSLKVSTRKRSAISHQRAAPALRKPPSGAGPLKGRLPSRGVERNDSVGEFTVVYMRNELERPNIQGSSRQNMDN
jgi:hypothetical protein